MIKAERVLELGAKTLAFGAKTFILTAAVCEGMAYHAYRTMGLAQEMRYGVMITELDRDENMYFDAGLVALAIGAALAGSSVLVQQMRLPAEHKEAPAEPPTANTLNPPPSS